MRKTVGRFGLVAGISGFLMLSGLTPAVAGDIQRAYQTMQHALSEYRDAVTQQADQNARLTVARRRLGRRRLREGRRRDGHKNGQQQP